MSRNLKTEELLKQLENIEDSDIFHYTNDLFQFLSFYAISPGSEPVTLSLLYYLYKNWSKTPISKKEFITDIKKFIPKDKLFYYINISTINLTKKALQIINNKTSPKIKSKKYKEHFEAFLHKYNISPGKYFVNFENIYKLYLFYNKSKYKTNLLSKQNFKEFIKLYFKKKANETIEWYGINITETEICEKLKTNDKKPNIPQ